MSKRPSRWHHTKSSTERGYGHAWRKLRARILHRDSYLCQPCKTKGRSTLATEVDHIKRKEDGGTDEPTNLQAICTECHKAKTIEENGGTPKQTIGLDGWPQG